MPPADRHDGSRSAGSRRSAPTRCWCCATTAATSARPGQFFMLQAEPEPRGAYLPRALSAAWADERRDRLPGRRPRRRHARAGRGRRGGGAAGRWAAVSSCADRPAILVGGGIGAAILPWLAPRAAAAAVATLLGFREQAQAVCARADRRRCRPWCWTRRCVTEPLARLLPVDGMRLRLRAGSDAARGGRAVRRARRAAARLAMEAAMACGFGACYGCAVADRRRVEAAVHRGAGAGGGDGSWRERPMLPGRPLCGIDLAHPLVNGSGTLDALAAGTLGLSAFVTKTVTLEPARGQPAASGSPRRRPGMVNSIGLANPGLERFCDEHLPRLAELGVPLIVSVGGLVARGVRRLLSPRIGAMPGCGCDRAERVLPERRHRLHLDRHRPVARRGRCSSAVAPRPTGRCWPSCRRAWPTSRRDRAGRRRGRGGGPGADQHGARDGDRPRHAAAAAGRRRGRPLRAGGEAGRAARDLPLPYAATGLPIVGMGGVAGGPGLPRVAWPPGRASSAIGTALFRDPALPGRSPRRTARAARASTASPGLRVSDRCSQNHRQ